MNALMMARGKKPHVIRFGRLLSKMTGLDGLKALNNDPATAAIAEMAFTGLSQKNALRLEPDRACAFLEKAEPGLDETRGLRRCGAALAAHHAEVETGGSDGGAGQMKVGRLTISHHLPSLQSKWTLYQPSIPTIRKLL
jgi:hypothetical protein